MWSGPILFVEKVSEIRLRWNDELTDLAVNLCPSELKLLNLRRQSWQFQTLTLFFQSL